MHFNTVSAVMSILFPFFKTGFIDPHVKGKARKLSKENEGNIFMTPETGKDFSHKVETKRMKKRMNKSATLTVLLIKRCYK